MHPTWIPTPRRVFHSEALEKACLEYSDTNEDISASSQSLNVQPGHLVVGITGSADLLLLSLQHAPAFVAGYDVNPAQNALAELKRAAIEKLSYQQYLSLLGYCEEHDRKRLLASVLDGVADDVRAFWQRDDMTQAIGNGLWTQGTATRKDLDRWESELKKLLDAIGPKDFSIAIGLDGTTEDRARIRRIVARNDPRYAESPFQNNNHFKFDPFQYPEGMVNQPAVAKYAAPFITKDLIRPPLSEQDFHRIRPHLHRASFQTFGIRDALDEMPQEAFDRLYLSNTTEYLTVAQERELVELMLEKAKLHATVVLLFLALTPKQHQDLLDHSAWSERGIPRFLNSAQWKERLRQVPIESWAKQLGDSAKHLASRGSGQSITRLRESLQSFEPSHVPRTVGTHLERTLRKAMTFDYARSTQHATKSLQSVWQQTRDRWKETRQLSEHDFVLIENKTRTLAFYSNLYANLRASYAAKSFYRFHHAILHKVQRRGPTYDIPPDLMEGRVGYR